jgi:hypothetical protein
MKNTIPTPIRVRRFIADRYAYRAQPDYLSELITFGVIVLTAFWSMFVLASAMAGTPK